MSGKYEGNDVLQQEQDLGLSLMRSFGSVVRTAALLTADNGRRAAIQEHCMIARRSRGQERLPDPQFVHAAHPIAA